MPSQLSFPGLTSSSTLRRRFASTLFWLRGVWRAPTKLDLTLFPRVVVRDSTASAFWKELLLLVLEPICFWLGEHKLLKLQLKRYLIFYNDIQFVQGGVSCPSSLPKTWTHRQDLSMHYFLVRKHQSNKSLHIFNYHVTFLVPGDV